MQCTNLLRVVQDEGRAWSLLQRGFGVVVEERKDLDSCVGSSSSHQITTEEEKLLFQKKNKSAFKDEKNTLIN